MRPVLAPGHVCNESTLHMPYSRPSSPERPLVPMWALNRELPRAWLNRSVDLNLILFSCCAKYRHAHEGLFRGLSTVSHGGGSTMTCSLQSFNYSGKMDCARKLSLPTGSGQIFTSKATTKWLKTKNSQNVLDLDDQKAV